METLKYELVYDGGTASESRLPAHSGATSLEGMTWTFALISHYAATGKIRTRGELSPDIRIYLAPSRQGSYIQELWVFLTEPNSLFLTSVAGSYIAGTASQAVNSLVTSTIRQVCGLTVTLLKREEDTLNLLPSGDREALIDKIEPSMRRAHSVIGDGATTLELKQERKSLLQLDQVTKDYVNADFLTDETLMVVSVGAYNANSGNGSAYLPDVGKTVRFYAPKGLDSDTYAALSYSLDKYVNRLPSEIQIACVPTISLDSRYKRLRIVRAFKTILRT
ncbi:DUF7946 domain-containing protein [Rhizobium multihospitium]|uniref:DUF7946 domain-containing protein n=1 Tax=Rhizobium multihospitium TaxID=410764 RepID=A0A1C3VKA9_9HYPH|nr:hypothetical protein [Rhizobium multihospitium]SCB27914.1 hypothetical protein GA0061103_3885 [Rhizobium multihospitium]